MLPQLIVMVSSIQKVIQLPILLYDLPHHTEMCYEDFIICSTRNHGHRVDALIRAEWFLILDFCSNPTCIIVMPEHSKWKEQ